MKYIEINKNWLKERESKWEIALYRELQEEEIEEITAKKEYFFNGDLNKYLKDIAHPSFYEAIFYSPAQSQDDFIQIMIDYWEWILELPEVRGKDYYKRSFDQQFEAVCSVFLGDSPYLEYEMQRDLFVFVYGKSYEPVRKLQLNIGPQNWHPEIVIKPHSYSKQLMSHIDRYLFGDSYQCYQHRIDVFIEYFISVINFLEPEDFAITYAPKPYYKDNEKKIRISEAGQWIVRQFYAHMEGYLTEDDYDEENECKYDTLPHNDLKREKYLRELLSRIKMPDEYYELITFINEYKENCMYPDDEEEDVDW